MQKLIKLLKRAHAIEVGAYQAYEGHWRSLPNDSVAQNTIKAIQIDELNHKNDLAYILKELGSKPSPVLDGLLWFIGKSISISCYFMGYRMAMWGAKLMETIGAEMYENLMCQCISDNDWRYISYFTEMASTERDHERLLEKFVNNKASLNRAAKIRSVR